MVNFKDKVIYQIYPRSFKDSNADGIGDLKGITQKLDYLQELGIDYLWITPFFVSPQKDNGYDVANYFEIDPRFGTMDDFDELSAEAGKRGIGLMLDMVFNHTSTEHEWFQKALQGDKNYQDYYIFSDNPQDIIPTNWQSKFGGSAWEYVDSLKKWYLHLFDVSQADLNWENLKVREELKKVILFWKNKGVSGFRFDVINLISKPQQFLDDFEGDGRRFYTDGHHVHDFLKELVKDTGIDEMVTVGEMSSTTLGNCIRYSNPSEKELSMCFNFHHLKVDYKNGNKWELAPVDRKKLKNLFKTWQEGMQAAGGWNALFWTNHDQPRTISRFGDEQKYFLESGKMLAAMIHLMRGTPYIYQGEEIGMLNTHYADISSYKDVESLNYFDILLKQNKTSKEALEIINSRSRDNCRTPFQWDDSKYSGFSSAKPWIEIPEYGKHITAKAQENDEASILAFYKKLILLRKTMPIISEGDIEFFFDDIDEVMAYKRIYNGEELDVICNMTDSVITIEQNSKTGAVLLSNYSNNDILEDRIVLKPYEFVVVYAN